MTKSELEQYCTRIENERNGYKDCLFAIMKILINADEMFSTGMAEESQYNDGIKSALSVIAKCINNRANIEEMKVPTFRPTTPVIIFQKGGEK